MAFVDSTIVSNTNFFAADTAVIPAPAGLAAGMAMIAIVGCSSVNIPTTFDPIWTLIGSTSASGVGPTLAAYVGVAVNPIPASYSFQYAAPEGGIMGSIAAYSNGTVVGHRDPTSNFNVANPPGTFTLTLGAHAVAVNATIVYGCYITNIDVTATQILVMPPQSVTRESAPWIPADVGTQRAFMGLSDEVLVAASEPARSIDFTWGQVGQPASSVFFRIIAIAAPVTTSGGFGFLPTAPGFAAT
jgi:hypothetical protein